ncbi:MAG: hypothetical protein GEU79_00595 [Acidimicrobiia bacterium]|nr:hypothetical protein [Acidimicrobiia bacterium]
MSSSSVENRPELRGLYLANGFSGHGFQHSHAVGRYLAESMISTDRTPETDPSISSSDGPRHCLSHVW